MKCDYPDCQLTAYVEFCVLWSDAHDRYYIWRACHAHASTMVRRLTEGDWSGGVLPLELLNRYIDD